MQQDEAAILHLHFVRAQVGNVVDGGEEGAGCHLAGGVARQRADTGDKGAGLVQRTRGECHVREAEGSAAITRHQGERTAAQVERGAVAHGERTAQSGNSSGGKAAFAHGQTTSQAVGSRAQGQNTRAVLGHGSGIADGADGGIGAGGNLVEILEVHPAAILSSAEHQRAVTGDGGAAHALGQLVTAGNGLAICNGYPRTNGHLSAGG